MSQDHQLTSCPDRCLSGNRDRLGYSAQLDNNTNVLLPGSGDVARSSGGRSQVGHYSGESTSGPLTLHALVATHPSTQLLASREVEAHVEPSGHWHCTTACAVHCEAVESDDKHVLARGLEPTSRGPPLRTRSHDATCESNKAAQAALFSSSRESRRRRCGRDGRRTAARYSRAAGRPVVEEPRRLVVFHPGHPCKEPGGATGKRRRRIGHSGAVE